MQTLLAGTVIADRYEVLAPIGAGANGAVYRATDRKLERTVALKHMKRADDEPDRERRFEQEAETLKALHHDGIPEVLDFFALNGELYVSMAFIEGKSLDTIVKADGPLEVKRALEYAAQVCDILVYLHGQHVPVIHRDIKPHNIILHQNQDRVSLVDFGLARPLSANRNSEAVGTMGYCPLEQVQGRAERRSDLYAVGVTLYYLLSGKSPRALKTPSLEQAMAGAVAPQVAFIVNMACQSTPNLRYASAEKMAHAIRRTMAELDRPAEESSKTSKAPVEVASKSGCMGMGLLVIGLSMTLCLAPQHTARNGAGSRWMSTNQAPSLTDGTGLNSR